MVRRKIFPVKHFFYPSLPFSLLPPLPSFLNSFLPLSVPSPCPFSFYTSRFPPSSSTFSFYLFLPLPPSPALLLVSEFLDFSSRTDSFCGSMKDRYGDRHESKTGIRNDKRKKHVNRRTQRNMKGRTWIASLREHLTI